MEGKYLISIASEVRLKTNTSDARNCTNTPTLNKL
jgi:hypothetical protein